MDLRTRDGRRLVPLVMGGGGLVALMAGLWLVTDRGATTPPVPPRDPMRLPDPAAEAPEAPRADPEGAAVEPVPTDPFARERVLRRQVGEPHRPDHGPLLERGGGSLRFELRDARGTRLDPRG